MDLSKVRHDNITLEDTGLPGGGAIDSAASALKNFAGSIRHRAQLKQGIELASQGRYSELSGGMVDQMIAAGVNPSMYNRSPTWLSRPGNASIAASQGGQGVNPNLVTGNADPMNFFTSTTFKYIVVGVIIIIAVYFLSKKIK